MHLDVVDLKAFYDRTSLGRTAQRVLRSQLRTAWPSLKGRSVAGYGFATPVLRPFVNEAHRLIALMPGRQGVMPWPGEGNNAAVLCEETRWPVQTGSIDRLVVLHGLETSERPDALLDEMWRVLAPEGRVLIVVPNRLGLWARRDATPFGFGRPYSLGQLESQLRQHRFVPESHMAALFSPPSQKRFWLKMAPAWERIGKSVSSHLAGGVLMVEASKQVYAPTMRGLPEAVRRPLRVLDGIGRPDPEPASGRVAVRLRGRPFHQR
ncbi:MAG: class I SAM-dependent methyltransferase [Paracoccaceae bacterium]